MINEENLTKMYEGIIEGKVLTTKELNTYGFNSKDLTNLIEDGTLERVKRGYYSFKSIDDLYLYGKKLISMKEGEKATACFEKCHELDSNHSGACFQLFLRCIQNKNYKQAFEYFDYIFNTDNKYYKNDSNYYLYLLSMITELPDNYKEYTKSLKIEDIKVNIDDKRYHDIPTQNKIRILSLDQRFILAVKQLNDLVKQNDRWSVQNIVIKFLLNEAVNEQKRRKKHIISLIKEKQYDEIIKYLENIQEQSILTNADKCILSLSKGLIEIIKTGIIPEKQIVKAPGLFETINSKNYELALSLLSSNDIKEYNIDLNNNAIYLLLAEITNLIDKKKNTIPEEVKAQPQENKPIEIDEKQEIRQETTITSSSCNNTFADVIGYLMKNDLDNSFITLRNYLDSIGKREYEFLIIDLIKISLIEKDIAFTKPMIALTYITKDNFEFNVSEYIQDFYKNLAENNFDIARIYLDIISKSNVLGQTVVKGLEQVLNITENLSNQLQNNEILNKVEQAIQNIPSIENKQVPTTSVINQPSITKKEQPVNKSKLIQSSKKDYDDTEFVNRTVDDLLKNKKGIILLKPMDSERRKGIHDIVKNIPDVVSFEIGDDSSKQVVLRYCPDIKEEINFGKQMKLGAKAYYSGDYDTCIKVYRQLLQCKSPSTSIYAKLGFAYMKKTWIYVAIDYLTVATELNKNIGNNFDFTEVIARLKGEMPDEDQKRYVKMTTSEFKNDVDDYYGIKQVEQVAQLVSSGLSLDDACLDMGIDDEQKNIITLIFAKESYAQGNDLIGDQYLKKAERAKNKSKFVKSLLEEVRKNKRFYINRVEEGQKRLVLTPKNKI